MRLIDADVFIEALYPFVSFGSVDFAEVKMLVNSMSTIQPEQCTDILKAEIKRMKRSFTTCINSDYYTGYMSALSALEGYIAKMEGDAE